MRISDWSSDVCASYRREALDQAYRSNPSLTGARAGLRALDEGVPQAKALGRPTLSVTTGLTQSFRGLGRLDSGGRSLTVNGDIDIPLFQGGRVGSAIRSRSEEHTSELQSLMRISYAVFCLKTKIHRNSSETIRHKQDINHI